MHATDEFVNGELIRLSGMVRVDGVPVEPDDVIIRVRKPGAGEEEELVYRYSDDEVTKVESEEPEPRIVYFVLQPADEDGVWQWRFESTGAGQAAGYKKFKVSGSFS